MKNTIRRLLSAVLALACSAVQAASVKDTCEWSLPTGTAAYMQELSVAVNSYVEIPADARALLVAAINKRQWIAQVEIRRSGIKSLTFGDQAEYSDLREMHFGDGSVCRSLTMGTWPESHAENALIYEAVSPSTGKPYTVAIPSICRNVSRITRTAPAGGSSLLRTVVPEKLDKLSIGEIGGTGGLTDTLYSVPLLTLTTTEMSTFLDVVASSYLDSPFWDSPRITAEQFFYEHRYMPLLPELVYLWQPPVADFAVPVGSTDVADGRMGLLPVDPRTGTEVVLPKELTPQPAITPVDVDVTKVVPAAVVPEPSTFGLMLMGLGILGLLVNRRVAAR